MRHHLAAVAHAQREGISPIKKLCEHLFQFFIEQNRLRPSAARAEHIAVAKATTSSKPGKISKARTAGEQVTHRHIHSSKTRAVERRRHLHLPVHALFAQNGNARSRRVNERRIHPFGHIERHTDRKPRPLRIVQQRKLLLRAGRVVAQRLDVEARLSPCLVQRSTCVLVDNFVTIAKDHSFSRDRTPQHAHVQVKRRKEVLHIGK